jgi:hypothetical protein
MTFFRRRLIALSLAWLACQATSLTALLPQDCCPAHHQPAEASKDCHEKEATQAQQAAADQCPMHSADGKPCPMHGGAQNQDRPCAMRGTCNGPAAALATLLSIPGILADESPVAVVDRIGTLVSTDDVSPSLFVPLDTPPPRS